MKTKITIYSVEDALQGGNETNMYMKKDFLNVDLKKTTLKQILLCLSNLIVNSKNKNNKYYLYKKS
ncbi:hypothetical protein [Aliarcobacter butzleri]|uniref:hypothetical protein n=1 Tax=Aliarcobacter butzleri TaxID=28197 RepID=UPI002B248C9F|nr:hypothetical protein [Aliarcobacter butzleri]